MDAIVLGAGFVGLGAALALQARGRSVALFDRRAAPGAETSFGPTGIVQSEAVYPYTFPRKPTEIVAAALGRDDRAHVRWSSLPSVAPALWRYYLASAPSARAESGAALRPLVARAVPEHRALADAAGVTPPLLRSGGWIKAVRTERGRDRALAEAEEARVHGVAFSTLDRAALLRLEPNLGEAFVGGVHFPDPLSTSDPAALAAAYEALFVRRGGLRLTGEASTLEACEGGWRAISSEGPVQARDVVVALGPWAGAFVESLGYSAPFFVKRGYHMHYAPQAGGLNRPVLDYEHGYVVTPMARGLRLTTGAEFGRVEDTASPAHLERVEPRAREVYPLGERLDAEPWLGRRPCLPDMLPAIGPAPRHPGLWFDFGHHHLGLTLGPASGRLLAEMMTGEAPFTDPAPYRIERFG